MKRPRWILDLHPDFPGSAAVAARVPSPVLVTQEDAVLGRFPPVELPAVGYGTMRTMMQLMRTPSLANAVFDDYPALRCASYYRAIYDLLGRTCVLVPFTALALLPLEKMFGSAFFVRPDTNYKLFPATILTAATLGPWVQAYAHHADELVVVSEVVTFISEYRCFCRNGSFVCGSSYPAQPYAPVPDEVRSFAEQVAARLMDRGLTMVTVDVGVGQGRMRVVEVGGVNNWGIYGADVDAFITMMEAEALARVEDLA